ncbi:SGNH/GDSL hydrolase family protein [Streptosporangium sp. CA-135522]|uniref:SGNH/GDSL hydrolase family protein n=1 Tax=Streptosporangium sp. CA-135522 TaxID=3240072 RepID=UPI003D938217
MHAVPRRLSPVLALTLATLLAGSGTASAVTSAPATAATAHGWVATWTASPHRPSASFTPNWSEQGFANQTIRQVVRVSTGGALIRIRLSNAYGTTPLKVTGATVARTVNGAAVRPRSLRHLTVNQARAFTVPAGAELASDPMPLPLTALDSVTVTLYVAAPTGPATYHAQAMAISYRADGDHRADSGAEAFTETSPSWYYLSGVDVIGGTSRRAGVVAFGDSITDGYGSRPGADNRYPDELAERLAAMGRPRAVLNQGIGGNRVTVDSACLGDKATSRFRRDVLGQPGVGTVIILEGINDIGMSEAPTPIGAPPTDVSAKEIIAGHRDLIRQARAKGLRVIGATLPPMKGSRYYTVRSEAKRDEVNTWIRASGEYDEVVDFDRELASPSDEDRLDPAYDVGDHLHPNDAGYRAMAHAVDPADLD